MKIPVLWDIIPCTVVIVFWRSLLPPFHCLYSEVQFFCSEGMNGMKRNEITCSCLQLRTLLYCCTNVIQFTSTCPLPITVSCCCFTFCSTLYTSFSVLLTAAIVYSFYAFGGHFPMSYGVYISLTVLSC